jgi:hypothetical protein
MSCEVCCEPFNLSTRARVKCPYCPFRACTGCSERYLCDTTGDAHCMACRKGWSREILVDNFTQKFVGRTYKTRREDLLFEREKSLMPATQPYVELEKKIRQLNDQITQIRKVMERANEKLVRVTHRPLEAIMGEYGVENTFDAAVIRHVMISEARKVYSNLAIDLQHVEWHQVQLHNRLHGNQMENERRQFVRACPFQDCRGFLSTAWKCGMCENWTCPECHEVKGREKDGPHECDPNSVATAQLLARDSRNCPKCAALIFKIDGCDQMWCTQCHTAFSWRTGQIETHVIHNPHYYDFMRARGTLPRNPGDVPCGGFPEWITIHQLVPRSHVFWNTITGAHRSWGHCQWYVLPRYAVDAAADNRDLRIKFMVGDFDEDEFKRKIQQREKARQRKTDIRQVLEMYMAVLTDLFQAFVQTRQDDELVDSLCELRNHVNATMGNVSRRYSKCAVPRISENFDVI